MYNEALQWLNVALDLNDGDTPFPWQKKLLSLLLNTQFRRAIDVPTGLGKTSILAIWLVALAAHAKNGDGSHFPRRLVYVVNRRTVVDQATAEAEKLRRLVLEDPGLQEAKKCLCSLAVDTDPSPLAISTLRGQFADNGAWRIDPARPAVVVGTVDMIGSRLLFSGYGRCGFKSKPLHAGLLGQDTLLVHDEAHLEPAFQRLLETIEAEQRYPRSGSTLSDSLPLRIMALSATVRTNEAQEATQDHGGPLFGKEDEDHKIASKRLRARKWLDFHPATNEKDLALVVASKALDFRNSGKAILVFLRLVKDVEEVAKLLRKEMPESVETLTGTQRGWERDQLTNDNKIFARFLPPKDRRTEPKEGTVYQVCTSAGEVGVNLSAEHLVCDVTPLDSMIQRFGRVNRFGNGDARIEIVFVGNAKKVAVQPVGAVPTQPETATANAGEGDTSSEPETMQTDESTGKDRKEVGPLHLACEQTRALLLTLPEGKDDGDRVGRLASPSALRQILSTLPPEKRKAAFTPEPVILPATDILFDAWTLTTVRGKLPGRPPVADWLHGIGDWEPPQTHVAWREEVAVITGPLLETYPPDDLLEDYPLKPHERLRDRTERVFEQLKKIAARAPDLPVWVLDRDGELRVPVPTLAELAAENSDGLEHAMVILPPAAGGLGKNGVLDGDDKWGEGEDHSVYDIADRWTDRQSQPRLRVWNDVYRPRGMRLVRRIDLPAEADAEDDDEPEIRSWFWYVRPASADDDGSRGARKEQELSTHLSWTGEFAERLVEKLGLSRTEPKLARAIVLAARWHDLGKDRRMWQRSIGNPNPNNVLAKSGPRMRPLDNLTRYRHELGSLLDVADNEEFKKLDADSQELVLHLIAAHHGRARPHFPSDEAFDPEPRGRDVHSTAAAVPQRFARLQRRYGRWGLAWLESLLRAADAMASNAILQDEDASSDEGADHEPAG